MTRAQYRGFQIQFETVLSPSGRSYKTAIARGDFFREIGAFGSAIDALSAAQAIVDLLIEAS